MKLRYAILTALAVVAIFAAFTVRTYGLPGHTENGGFTVQLGSWFYGYEVWGHPGFFTEDCSNGC